MGVAHMKHPYELPGIKTGDDLIEFFKDAAVHLSTESGATLKVDGLNMPIKIVTNPETGEKQFASDRGTMSPKDVSGITLGNVDQRWSKAHGLTVATINTLKVFERAKNLIENELKILGLWDDPSYYLDLEYVAGGKSNIIRYENISPNFLLFHNVNQFYEKPTDKPDKASRAGAERPIDPSGKPTTDPFRIVPRDSDEQQALQSLIDKVNKVNTDFKIYLPFMVRPKEGEAIDIEKALNTDFSIKMSDEPERIVTKPLKDWLEKAVNPIGKSIKLIDGSRENVFKKSLYLALEGGMPLDRLVPTRETESAVQARMLVDAAVFWHATRILGNSVLSGLTSDLGDVISHEGVVIGDEDRLIKITGEFLAGVVRSPFNIPKKDVEPTAEPEEVAAETIVLFPGGFKPPHKGHLDAVTRVGVPFTELQIIMGSGGASPRMIGDEIVDFGKSAALWAKYLDDAGITNYKFVEIKPDEKFKYLDRKTGQEKLMTMTPFNKAIDIIRNSSAGQTFVLLASSKDADRFDVSAMHKRGEVPEGVEVVTKETPAFKAETGEELSATFLRQAVENNDMESFKKFIPETSEADAEQIFAYLGGKKKVEPEEPTVAAEILQTVESLLAERDYQKQSERIRTHVKRRKKLIGKGKQKPGPPYTKKPPKKRSKSGPPGFAAAEEAIENEDAEILDEETVEEASSMAAGNVAGYAGGVGDEDDEDDKKPSLIRQESNNKLVINKSKLKKIIEEEMSAIPIAASAAVLNRIANELTNMLGGFAQQNLQQAQQALNQMEEEEAQQAAMVAAQEDAIKAKEEDAEDKWRADRWRKARMIGAMKKMLELRENIRHQVNTLLNEATPSTKPMGTKRKKPDVEYFDFPEQTITAEKPEKPQFETSATSTTSREPAIPQGSVERTWSEIGKIYDEPMKPFQTPTERQKELAQMPYSYTEEGSETYSSPEARERGSLFQRITGQGSPQAAYAQELADTGEERPLTDKEREKYNVLPSGYEGASGGRFARQAGDLEKEYVRQQGSQPVEHHWGERAVSEESALARDTFNPERVKDPKLRARIIKQLDDAGFKPVKDSLGRTQYISPARLSRGRESQTGGISRDEPTGALDFMYQTIRRARKRKKERAARGESDIAAVKRAEKDKTFGLRENKEDKEFIDGVMSYLLEKPGVNLND